GLTIEEIRDLPAKRAAVLSRVQSLGVPRGNVSPRTQPFMLATLAERPVSGKEWLFEIKYDGVRVLASRRGEVVALYGRSGQEITGRYPELVSALRALTVEAFLIDGRIVGLDH